VNHWYYAANQKNYHDRKNKTSKEGKIYIFETSSGQFLDHTPQKKSTLPFSQRFNLFYKFFCENFFSYPFYNWGAVSFHKSFLCTILINVRGNNSKTALLQWHDPGILHRTILILKSIRFKKLKLFLIFSDDHLPTDMCTLCSENVLPLDDKKKITALREVDNSNVHCSSSENVSHL